MAVSSSLLAPPSLRVSWDDGSGGRAAFVTAGGKRGCLPSHNPGLTTHGRSKRRLALDCGASLRSESDDAGKGSFTPPKLTSPTEYKDSFFDLAFIHLCRQAFGNVANWQSSRSWEEGYLGMVEVSYALMRRKSAAQQQAAVLKGFPVVPDWFRKLFPYSDWGAEFNAKITPRFFQWLVGPCEVTHSEVDGKKLNNVVWIQKCRYLETSGCVGMCVNLCKMPTQHFFTNELGMPLRMEPNFGDMSCKMIFGQSPLDPEADPALKQPCFVSCPSSNPSSPMCHKLK